MATQSGQGMRDQGTGPQGVWGNPGADATGIAPHGNPVGPHPETTYTQIPQVPGQPAGVQMRPDVTGWQGGQSKRMPPAIGTPPPGMSTPITGPGAPQPPGTPGTPGAPTGAPATPAALGAPAAGPLPGAGTSISPRPQPVPPGTMSPSGTPVHPDGGYDTPDGGHDWMPGYGPQMDFGGQDIRTGRAPVAPDPGDPDTVTGGARGTRAWNQAYQAHDAWIRQNLDAGLHLADLGLAPTRGGGLSSYMRYGGYQPAGGAGGAPAAAPAAPAAPPPPGPNTGGGLPGVVPGQMQYGGGADLNAALMQLLGMGQGR